MRHRHVCLAAGKIAMIIQREIVSICFFLLFTGISLGPSWAMTASLSARSPMPEAATACQDRCVPKIALSEGPLGPIHTKWYILTQSGGRSKNFPDREFVYRIYVYRIYHFFECPWLFHHFVEAVEGRLSYIRHFAIHSQIGYIHIH